MSVTDRLLRAIEREERAVLFTVIEGEPLGAHVLVVEGGERYGQGVPEEILAQAETLIREHRSRIVEASGIKVFCDVYGPPPRLLVYGAVDTAEALCAAARLLGASWASVERGLAKVENPGRLERLGDLILDGAHNPEGAFALRRALLDHGLLPVAFSREKDHRKMAEALRGLGPVVLTRYASSRSMPPSELLPLFPGALVEEDPFRAIERARTLAPRVVVTGSLFLVGEVHRGLRGLPPEERYQ